MTQSLINQDSTDQSGKQLLEPRLWVERHADFLYSYAFARLNDDEQCRDLVQETFLAALQKTDSFRGDSSERTWLTAILRYKVIDVYRKRSGALNAKERDGAAVYEEDFLNLMMIIGNASTGPRFLAWKIRTHCITRSLWAYCNNACNACRLCGCRYFV